MFTKSISKNTPLRLNENALLFVSRCFGIAKVTSSKNALLVALSALKKKEPPKELLFFVLEMSGINFNLVLDTFAQIVILGVIRRRELVVVTVRNNASVVEGHSVQAVGCSDSASL